MGMIMGMGHWLLWAVLALVALFAMINLIAWMRQEKQRGISNTQNTPRTLAQTTNQPEPANMNQTSEHPQARHDAEKHKGWGFWPWALLSLLVLGGLAGLIWKSSMAPDAMAFQWVLWALLPMAGLISLLGIAQMNRRHPLVDEKKGSPRGLGFLTLLSGLILGLASWFVWQPQTTGFSSLQEQVGELTTKSEGLASKLSSRNTIIKRLRGDADKEASRYADLKKDMEAANTTSAGEISRLKTQISSLKEQLSASKSDGDQISRLTARVRSLGAEKENLVAKRESLATERDKLVTERDNLTTENGRMNALIGTYKNDLEVQSAKIEALNAEIQTLKAQIEALRNAPADPAPR